MFQIGDFVPGFTDGSEFALQNYAGKYVVLCFFGSTANPFSRRVLDDIERQGERFHGEHLMFVGVSADPKDSNLRPGREHGTYLADPKHQLSRQYQVNSPDGTQFHPQTLMIDPLQRVAAVLPFAGDPETYVSRLLENLNGLFALQDQAAPVIVHPNVFEPEFCRTLIRLFDRDGGHKGAAMVNVAGQAQQVYDDRFKNCLEYAITDQAVQDGANQRVGRRLVPEVRRALQFQAAWVERHLLACFDAAQGGWFKAHRDNSSSLTAHRKFAFTINLNSEDYEGGDLCFPEYGTRLYRGPTGAAMVFSATLLHESKPVTKGRRYAYVSYLYDREGFEQRVLMELRRQRQGASPQDVGTMDVTQQARQIVDAHLKKHGF